MLIIVVLPEPDGPAIATNSPSSTAIETPRSASTRTWPMSYVRLTPSRRMRLIGSAALRDDAAAGAPAAAEEAAAAVRVVGRLRGAGARDHPLTRLQPRLDLGQGAGHEANLDRARADAAVRGDDSDRVVARRAVEGP